MSTTFSSTFKNLTINALTGAGSPASAPIRYFGAYTGTQTADPSIAPGGTQVWPTASSGIDLSSQMTVAGEGVAQLASQRSANATNTATSLTIARFLNASSVGLIDTDISLAGGGGGAIVNSLNTNAGSPLTLVDFSLKLPSSLGTVKLNAALVNRLVDWWTGQSTTAPQFGINTGGASTLNIYSGTAPATADESLSGNTLLASISIGGTNVFGAASAGSAALTGPLSVLASGTGTATFFRWSKVQGASTFVIQGTVGTSGADMTVNTTSITSGVTTVTVSDATLSI